MKTIVAGSRTQPTETVAASSRGRTTATDTELTTTAERTGTRESMISTNTFYKESYCSKQFVSYKIVLLTAGTCRTCEPFLTNAFHKESHRSKCFVSYKIVFLFSTNFTHHNAMAEFNSYSTSQGPVMHQNQPNETPIIDNRTNSSR